MHDSTESSLLCFTPVLQTTYYRLVESCRGQLEGDILSATGGAPLRYRLYQSHAQLFRCLPYVTCSTASDEKLGVGLGRTRLPRTSNCRPSTMNDNWLHRKPHLPLYAAPGLLAYDHSENDYWHAVRPFIRRAPQ